MDVMILDTRLYGVKSSMHKRMCLQESSVYKLVLVEMIVYLKDGEEEEERNLRIDRWLKNPERHVRKNEILVD